MRKVQRGEDVQSHLGYSLDEGPCPVNTYSVRPISPGLVENRLAQNAAMMCIEFVRTCWLAIPSQIFVKKGVSECIKLVID